MTLPTVALTLIQPWGSLIMLTDPKVRKDVENRVWVPSAKRLKVGDRLWIHAGMKIDGDARFEYDHLIDDGDRPLSRGAILGHVRFDGVVTESDSPWFVGPFGWLVNDPVPLLRPVPCIGALQVWTVNERMMTKLREAV